MKYALLLVVSCLLLSPSCADDDSNDAIVIYELGQAFILAPGQTAVCACTARDFTFVEVISDGRCPDSGLLCHLPSVAEIGVEIRGQMESLFIIKDAITAPQGTPITVGGYTYQALDINPDPIVDFQEDYRIEFLINRD